MFWFLVVVSLLFSNTREREGGGQKRGREMNKEEMEERKRKGRESQGGEGKRWQTWGKEGKG